tara:strand:- start:3884 stop:4834 length:951 start_codon:yes stop_codon:yes gene_type:complete
MKTKPIIIVAGEPKSVFFEIFFKCLKSYNFKTPLILIASNEIVKLQMKKLNFKKTINLIDKSDLETKKLNNKVLNLIDVNYETVPSQSLNYISKCFEISFDILRKGLSNKLVNGPIKKSSFLNKKFLGITEYISKKFNIKKNAMLIYDNDLSVCPLTTHLPLKMVVKKINQKAIKEKVHLIDNFYKKNRGFKPKIAVTGLNPHCESILQFNEDEKILSPAINFLKKKNYRVFGPFPADTIFLKQNRRKYDVILGMYHDQVLSPIKTLKEYNAINITLGLPFLRVSPDHGPNEKMINKNSSNPLSLMNSLKFLDRSD